MPFDSSPLFLFFAMIIGLLTLAAFDFYAYSPRPSGFGLRSRELAPVVIVLLSLTAALLSLKFQSTIDLDQLIAQGANYAPRTIGSDRIRLLTYIFVATNPFEGVLLGISILASAVFLGRFGMLGWSLILLGTTASTGLAAAMLNPEGLTYGPFEVCAGLAVCSLFFLVEMCLTREPRRHFSLKRLGENILPLNAFIVSALAAIALGYLRSSPFRPELIVTAASIAISIAILFAAIQRLSGPHWEASLLFFVSAIAGFVAIGFVAYIAPQGFDLPRWRQEGFTIRAQIHENLQTAMNSVSHRSGEPATSPETELVFANELDVAGKRLAYFLARGERGPIGPGDVNAINEMKLIGRMIAILEKVHRSRAAVQDAERRTRAAIFQSDAFTQTDALHTFWQQDRPWMDAELVLLRAEPSMNGFVQALNTDLDRLTQAALDVEVRRVDAWVDWATRQPRSRLPSMKVVAFEQAARLESLSKLTTTTKSSRLPPDPRISTLHRNLTRMASVSSTGKWE